MAQLITNINNTVKYLREGNVVAIPTETVYGLGANIYNEEALLNIFRFKGRPSSNPLIVHTYDIEQALNLYDLTFNPNLEKIIRILGNQFWPGPLTIISKAKSNISKTITAGTGNIAVRIPNNKKSLEILKKLKDIPIAAPSANKSGHISPVDSLHVLSEFKDDNIYVFHSGHIRFFEDKVGIESTVIQIDDNEKNINICRQGGITFDDLDFFVKEKINDYKVIIAPCASSPGQSIKHYAIKDKETIMVDSYKELSLEDLEIKNSALIDFGSLAKVFDGKILYRNLSKRQNIDEAMMNLYDYLREIEGFSNISKVYIIKDSKNYDQKWNGLYDRIFRACSGQYITKN